VSLPSRTVTSTSLPARGWTRRPSLKARPSPPSRTPSWPTPCPRTSLPSSATSASTASTTTSGSTRAPSTSPALCWPWWTSCWSWGPAIRPRTALWCTAAPSTPPSTAPSTRRRPTTAPRRRPRTRSSSAPTASPPTLLPTSPTTTTSWPPAALLRPSTSGVQTTTAMSPAWRALWTPSASTARTSTSSWCRWSTWCGTASPSVCPSAPATPSPWPTCWKRCPLTAPASCSICTTPAAASTSTSIRPSRPTTTTRSTTSSMHTPASAPSSRRWRAKVWPSQARSRSTPPCWPSRRDGPHPDAGRLPAGDRHGSREVRPQPHQPLRHRPGQRLPPLLRQLPHPGRRPRRPAGPSGPLHRRQERHLQRA
jgi:arginyl-tRNA synthetase (EC 6.1.1.19)